MILQEPDRDYLEIYDVSDPQVPIRVRIDTHYNADDLSIQGDCRYMNMGELPIFDISNPLRIRRVATYERGHDEPVVGSREVHARGDQE